MTVVRRRDGERHRSHEADGGVDEEDAGLEKNDEHEEQEVMCRDVHSCRQEVRKRP